MPILDKAIPFTLEIPMIGGLNEEKDPSTIPDIDFQKCEKVLLDRGVVEKFPEFTKLNPSNQLESGVKIDGAHRCYAKDGTARLIVVCNGKVYESSDWTTPIYTGLTAGKPCEFIPYRNQVMITNGYDYPMLYDPKTNVLGGSSYIESPLQIKKIAYFETDETGWSGGAADPETHVSDEWTGDSLQGRKLTASASSTQTMELGSLSLDLSKHPDGSDAIGYDAIYMSVYHRVLENISSLSLILETSGGNYYEFDILATQLDKDEQRDYQWTCFGIFKHQFAAVGAPNWNNITKIKIAVTATANGSADPTFDNIHLRRSPPQAWPMRKRVANFVPDQETWTGGTVTTLAYIEGGIARYLSDGDESMYCNKTIDLTRWADGKTISGSDLMSIWVLINDTTKVDNIVLRCGNSDMTAYKHYTFTQGSGELLVGTNFWQRLSKPLENFGTVGGHQWQNTTRIQIMATIASGGEAVFDCWQVDYTDQYGVIDRVEPVITGQTPTLYYSEWSRNYVSRGSFTIKFTPYSAPDWCSYFTSTYDTPIDLSKWDDGSESTDDDCIHFALTMGGMTSYIANLYIHFDCNNGDFATDYYYAQIGYPNIDYTDWTEGITRCFTFKKGDFTRVGTTGGKDWSTIKAVSVRIYCLNTVGDHIWYYDNLFMGRAADWKGEFRFKVVNLYGETRSSASEASNWIGVERSKAILEVIPTSNDSRVKEREIYRQAVGEEDFKFSTKIPNNTDTEWVDDLEEAGLTLAEMGVPEGNIAPAKGVTGLEYKDRILLFQDLANLKSVAYTDPYLIYSWKSARYLPDEVVGGEVHFDNLFLFLRDGRVYRFGDDIEGAVPQPLGDLLKCVSPWGICKVGEEIGVVTEDDIKLFNGYESRSIGKPLLPYLKQEDYKTEESVLFYHKDHLYYRVETRAGGSYKQFDCYVPEIRWESSGSEAFSCFCSYTGRGDKNEMVCGGYDGYVYKLDTTHNDAMEVRSKDFEEVNTTLGKGFAFHEKEVQEVRIIAKGAASAGTLVLKLYINGADSGISINVPEVGSHLATKYHCYVVPLTGVKDVLIGQQIGFSILHGTDGESNKDKNAYIKAVMLSGEVKPLEQQYTL